MYFVIRSLPDGKGAMLYQVSRDDLVKKLADGSYGKDPKFMTPDRLGANWDMPSREGTVIVEGEVVVPKQVTTYTLEAPEAKPAASSVDKVKAEAEKKTMTPNQQDRDDSI